VVIVRDTRESGPLLADGLAGGVAEAGGDAFDAGVLPTPAASILVRRLGLDLAAVVSASHNPWRDNGIKFFAADGQKLGPEAEGRIEERVFAMLAGEDEPAASEGLVRTLEASLDDYLRELHSSFRLDLTGLEVVLDCAHGATHRAAPEIFRRLGAEVEVIGADPDGRNINEGCGSTAPDALAERVASGGAAIGFAFDGDGDRVLAVDGRGEVRDGDELIAIGALHLKRAGELAGDGVAVTVMSNYGFHQAMAEAGIEVATTDVGDRHVATELARRGWSLGGEQSGHIIWTDYAPTGDGIAAALLVLRALGGEPLADARPFTRLPQVLTNVEVADREAIAGAEEVWAAVDEANTALEGRGRVLVRPSGTEPLVRVMVEAPTEDEANRVCEDLVALVRSELGAPQ
jgi:phosphoglucosamine mutase